MERAMTTELQDLTLARLPVISRKRAVEYTKARCGTETTNAAQPSSLHAGRRPGAAARRRRDLRGNWAARSRIRSPSRHLRHGGI